MDTDKCRKEEGDFHWPDFGPYWRLRKKYSGGVTGSPIFVFEDAGQERCARGVLARMPAVNGLAVRVEKVRGLRDARGEVHGGAFLRERRIALDCTRAEFPRIFAHEAAHFVWLRLGNAVRRSYEEVVKAEIAEGARGELGWSAEWRKAALAGEDAERRSRRWREYCCESFCDTAAWMYSRIAGHEEFTLGQARRRVRRAWFGHNMMRRALSI